MENLKCAIVDDEQLSISSLQRQIKRLYPSIEICYTDVDPQRALSWVHRHPFDLLMLGIEMPRMTGFEFLDKLSGIDFNLVFITAIEVYAVKAFRYNAVDYLLKPIEEHELRQCLKKIEAQEEVYRTTPQELERNGSCLSLRKPQAARISISNSQSIEFINPDQILFCASESNYTHIHLRCGTRKVVSRTLKAIDELLKPYNFFRIHHSYLVNLAYVQKFLRKDHSILLEGNKLLPLSQSKRDQFLSAMVALQ